MPTVADANAPPAGRLRQIQRPRDGASDTGAVVAFEDNVLSDCGFLSYGSTTGTNGTYVAYVAGDPDFDVYAAGGLDAFVCNTTFLGFDQFSFWKSCMGSHADAQLSRTRSSPPAAPRCPAPRSSAPAQTRPPSAPGSPPRAPAPRASTSTARPAPPPGPGTPAY